LKGKSASQKCSLVIVTDGFVETETIGMLCVLRRAGFCAKSVGLTTGLINGVHGILLMPDLTLADLERTLDVEALSLVILPGGERHLAGLETDPRVHRLLQQVAAHHGLVVTDASGAAWVTGALQQDQDERTRHLNGTLLVRHSFDQPVEVFAQDVIRRLEREAPV
jgi:protein deglycase